MRASTNASVQWLVYEFEDPQAEGGCSTVRKRIFFVESRVELSGWRGIDGGRVTLTRFDGGTFERWHGVIMADAKPM